MSQETEAPYGPMRALLETMGHELDVLNGRPSTFLRLPLEPGHTTAATNSTIGCPDSGAFWVGGMRFTYTSKVSNGFTGVASDPVYRYRTIPAGERLVIDVSAVEPEVDP